MTGTEKAKADGKLTANGMADGSKTYNLEALEGFDKDNLSAADATGNGIDVSGYASFTLAKTAANFPKGGGKYDVSTLVTDDTNAGNGTITYTEDGANSTITGGVLDVADGDKASTVTVTITKATSGSGDSTLAAFSRKVTFTQASTAATISGATYNANTGALAISGANLPETVVGWDFTKLKLQGIGTTRSDVTLEAHSADTSTADRFQGAITSAGTVMTITAHGDKRTDLNQILHKNGTEYSSSNDYNIDAAADFAGLGADADSTIAVTVSGVGFTLSKAAAKFDSVAAKYDVASLVADNADVGNGSISYALTGTSLNRGTTVSSAGLWTINTADRAKNDIVVTITKAASTGFKSHVRKLPFSAYAGAATITSAAYDYSTGVFTVVGTNLPETIAGYDLTDIDIEGAGTAVSLTAHATMGANRAELSRLSAIGFTITVHGTLKTSIDAKFDRDGTSSTGSAGYNFKASGGFIDTSSTADESSNTITVSNHS